MCITDLHRRLARTALVACVALLPPALHAAEPSDANQPPAADQPKISPRATEAPKPEAITPPKREEITASIERGTKFLLADQRPDGSWGSAENTKSMNIYAPAPGAHDAFRTAVTSLVIMALIDAQPLVAETERAEIDRAIDCGAAWLDGHLERLRRATPDTVYNVWGHSYALQCLVALHHRAQRNAERQAKIKEEAQHQADMLARYSFVGGGWSYYDFHFGTQVPGDSAFSFTTATALIALKQAEAIGITFPERLTKKAIASLVRQQKPDFSYAYGEYTRMDPRYDERPGGSLGRSQSCNLALRMYGDKRVTNEVLAAWLKRLIARNGWLDMARKRPVPHDSFFLVAGYFYYYGHWYAAQCIDELPSDERPPFQDQLAHIILPLQEKDGSWWDFPLYNYHQQYGTAMAVMTLAHCQKPE